MLRKKDCRRSITTLGTTCTVENTLCIKRKKNEDGKFEMCYLLDKVMGFEENQRLTEDAMVSIRRSCTDFFIDVK